MRKELIKSLKNNDKNISDIILEYINERCSICKSVFNKMLVKRNNKYICKYCSKNIIMNYIANYLLEKINNIFLIFFFILILFCLFIPFLIIPIFITYIISSGIRMILN